MIDLNIEEQFEEPQFEKKAQWLGHTVRINELDLICDIIIDYSLYKETDERGYISCQESTIINVDVDVLKAYNVDGEIINLSDENIKNYENKIKNYLKR